MSFLTPTDIANRALDHCGQDPIDVTLGFTENSPAARICGRVYDKLRKAELRRNVWRFATKRAILRAIDTDTMLLVPAMWSSTTNYLVGSIVSDETNQLWISAIQNNLNNQPENSYNWQEYFGPMTVHLYDSTVAYNAGELVYTTDGDGTNRVYLSLQSGNSDDPETATAWDSTVTYYTGQVVTYLTVPYMSAIDFNLNQTPTASPANWASATTYAIGDSVRGSDGIKYTSLIGANIGNDPTTDDGTNWTDTGTLVPWLSSFSGGTGSIKWLQIGGAEVTGGVALTTLNIVYPLGSGPSTQTATRNVYRLPCGFLRMASRDPKAGSTSAIGAPTNLGYTDWLFEGNYIVTQQSDPILCRFVADTVDVRTFDEMFCEGLAARIGYEICEPLTQSSDKLKTITGIYTQNMGDARIVNGIETGAEESPLDDYLACRF